jgi:hypothetical protein
VAASSEAIELAKRDGKHRFMDGPPEPRDDQTTIGARERVGPAIAEAETSPG